MCEVSIGFLPCQRHFRPPRAPRVGVEPTALILIQSQAGPAGRPTGDRCTLYVDGPSLTVRGSGGQSSRDARTPPPATDADGARTPIPINAAATGRLTLARRGMRAPGPST